MYFKQFSRKLSKDITGVAVARQLHCNGHLIEMTVDQIVKIDGSNTSFVTIQEAREYIKRQSSLSSLEQELQQENYEEVSDSQVAKIIAENNENVKVTDKLIEQYIDLASSKIFTVDKTINEIRNLNKFDRLIEGKIDFKLDDDSIVAIDEETQTLINKLLENYSDIVEHMRESKENFLSVIKRIKENKNNK